LNYFRRVNLEDNFLHKLNGSGLKHTLISLKTSFCGQAFSVLFWAIFHHKYYFLIIRYFKYFSIDAAVEGIKASEAIKIKARDYTPYYFENKRKADI
jgi:hypothetical protein